MPEHPLRDALCQLELIVRLAQQLQLRGGGHVPALHQGRRRLGRAQHRQIGPGLGAHVLRAGGGHHGLPQNLRQNPALTLPVRGGGVDAPGLRVGEAGVAVDAHKQVRPVGVGQAGPAVEGDVLVIPAGHEHRQPGLQQTGRLGGDGQIQILLRHAPVHRSAGAAAMARVQHHQGGEGRLRLLRRLLRHRLRGLPADGGGAACAVPGYVEPQGLGEDPQGDHGDPLLGYVSLRHVQRRAVQGDGHGPAVRAGGQDREGQEGTQNQERGEEAFHRQVLSLGQFLSHSNGSVRRCARSNIWKAGEIRFYSGRWSLSARWRVSLERTSDARPCTDRFLHMNSCVSKIDFPEYA